MGREHDLEGNPSHRETQMQGLCERYHPDQRSHEMNQNPFGVQLDLAQMGHPYPTQFRVTAFA